MHRPHSRPVKVALSLFTLLELVDETFELCELIVEAMEAKDHDELLILLVRLVCSLATLIAQFF